MKKYFQLFITSDFWTSSKSYNLSLPRLLTIIIIFIVFIVGLIVLIIYAMGIVINTNELSFLKKENKRLQEKLAQVQDLEKRINEIEKDREKLYLMLGVKKDTGKIDLTHFVFSYKPIIPEVETLITDSTMDTTTKSLELTDQVKYIPQVPPTVNFIITRTFSKTHHGVDFAAHEGAPVFATAEGVIKDVGWDSIFGNYIRIKHGTYYETFYGHLKEVDVKKGDKVKKNDIIGRVGNSGVSSGPHLHFEIWHKGEPVDPKDIFMLKKEFKGGAYE